MPDYRRLHRPGGTFFFTVITENRAPLFAAAAARSILRQAISSCRKGYPFDLVAIVLLPDHLHTLWTLPEEDDDFSTRWSFIKSAFTREYLKTTNREGPRSASRISHRNRGVWQRRFWEHAIRDQDDLNNHLNYIHYNPVKHGLAACPHAWPYSSFDRFVQRDVYAPDWSCACDGRSPLPLDFPTLPLIHME